MAMSVVYATVHGRLVQESRGGVVTRYVSDTLGSVIKTTDATGTVTSETTYWPFGEIRTQAGTNPSPWGFCGTLGYYKDAAARLYVRARMLRADLSRWLSVDPLWPGTSAYQYAYDSPVWFIDPSGLDACSDCCDAYKKNPGSFKDKPKADTIGVALCCGGQKCPCYIGSSSNPFIKECTEAHERDHFKDIKCPPTGNCRPPFSDPKREFPGECSAYQVGIKCIWNKCINRSVIDNDTLECATFIKGQCQLLKEKCGKAKITPPKDVLDICNKARFL